MSEVKVSVVIPTINRYSDLENTIKYLLIQDFEGFELIVIDQSPIIDSDLYQRYENKPNISFIRSQLKSASASRNIGIKEAKGDILLFLDDDVIIEDVNFIRKHFRHYEDPDIPGVFGCPLELEGNQKKTYQRHWMSYLSAEAGWLYFPSNFGCNAYISVGRSNNLSVRKDYAIAVRGMDENYLKGAHREEGDFCLRIHRKYGPFLFDPKASLVHIGNPLGGIRSWNKGNYVKEQHNMEGAIYFDLRMAPIKYCLLYYHATIRYLIFNKTILMRPQLWLLASGRIIRSFVNVLKMLSSGAKYMN